MKSWIPNLKENRTGKISFSRASIIETATNFYRNLYSKQPNESNVFQLQNAKNSLSNSTSILQRFNNFDIIKKIDKLKREKSNGPDNIPNEAILKGKLLLTPFLTTLFNKILDSRSIPIEWAKSDIILLYKKGDPADVNNYRPISLQSNLYKLFASCLESKISAQTEKFQPVEQAGFRKGFSTIDHIHVVEQAIEKYVEFRRPLYLAFIDYSKAFDSISHDSIWTALSECDMPLETIELLKDIYSKSISHIRLDRRGPKIDIHRGVRQGDPISPTIFISVLQSIMSKLKWEKKGINIKGKYMSNLRFADDIVLFSESASQIEEMINDLCAVSHEIGLDLNTSKTKIMTNHQERSIRIRTNNQTLEYVNHYTYLGKQLSFQKSRHYDEVNRRVNITWNKFWSYKEILKSELPITLKKKVMDSCLLPRQPNMDL